MAPFITLLISSEDNLLDVVILSDKNTTESKESTQITIEEPNLSLSDLEEKLGNINISIEKDYSKKETILKKYKKRLEKEKEQ